MSPVVSLRLTRQAIRERWPVTDEHRSKVVTSVTNILNSGDPNIALSASRIMILIDKLNLSQRALDIKAAPRAVLSGKLTSEDLLASIQDKLAELGMGNMSIEEAQKALPAMIENGITPGAIP